MHTRRNYCALNVYDVRVVQKIEAEVPQSCLLLSRCAAVTQLIGGLGLLAQSQSALSVGLPSQAKASSKIQSFGH
jgi:hypothetical protein